MQTLQPHGFFKTAQHSSEDTAEARARRRLLDFIRVPHTGRSARDAWRLGFRGLMELYEENYRIFQRLLPQLEAAVGVQFTLPGQDDLPLHVSILDVGPYTLTLRMTHRFLLDANTGAREEAPGLVVRLYRDALQAEALSIGEGEALKTFRVLLEAGNRPLQARWELNLFLNRWLQYCAAQGYSSAPAADPI
jgi:uncharacterized protein YqiB (DUF1249 family)